MGEGPDDAYGFSRKQRSEKMTSKQQPVKLTTTVLLPG
jgi:hypothetical protein